MTAELSLQKTESSSTHSFMSCESTASDMNDGNSHSDEENQEIKNQQLNLLSQQTESDELSEISTAPLFTYPVLKHAQHLATSTSSAAFSQYGLLAGDVRSLHKTSSKDPRVFYNVAAPASVFICGSQGSGKSHTLSCILENCLIQSEQLGCLPRPLTGIVFHYDDYASDSRVNPCEAAYLGSDPAISVRVLCSPTNIRTIKVCPSISRLRSAF